MKLEIKKPELQIDSFAFVGIDIFFGFSELTVEMLLFDAKFPNIPESIV